MKLNRRNFLIRTAWAGIIATTSSRLDDLFAKQIVRTGPLSLNALRIPPIISGGNLTVSETKFKIDGITDSGVISINNTFPSPTIRLKKGDTFSAKIINNLSEPTVIHWHGLHAPALMDGHPKNAIPAGGSYDVSFPITQRGGTFFYHSHADMNTGRQTYMGMAGMFFIEDDNEKTLGLPSGEYEIPLLIQDKRFDSGKQLVYAPSGIDKMGGWLGDTILVNGTPNPFLTVAPTLYRFRMVNASNARVYNIGLSDGKQFTIIGNDGGLLEKPVQVTSVMLAQAERLDVIVDLSSYLQGQSVTIKSLPFSFGGSPGSGTVPQGAELDLLQLQITKTGSSGGIIPQTLSQITKYDPANAIKTRSFEMQMHFINTKSFSMDRIDEKVKLGDLEQWTFANLSEDIHPMHVHGLQFQVLNRSGESQPSDEGWKDTVRVGPAEIVNVLLRYSDYVGLYLVHCHNLEHEDDGMMANVLVEASGKVKQEPDKSGLLRIHPNPATDETTLDFPLLEHEEILRVLDVRGAILHELICRTGTKNLTLELSKFLIGRYEVQLGNYRAHLNVIR